MQFWRGLTDAQPQSDRRTLNESEVVRRQLAATRCDPTTVLDLVEAALDRISGSTQIWAEANRLAATASQRNIGQRGLPCGKGSDLVGIMAAICQQH
jgi:hypothetical protein